MPERTALCPKRGDQPQGSVVLHQATVEAMKCWACPKPAFKVYVCLDEPDYPAPAYCRECADKFPPQAGVIVHG